MAIFGLSPFTKSKKNGAKKVSAKKAYQKMKSVKKKAKTCEFC